MRFIKNGNEIEVTLPCGRVTKVSTSDEQLLREFPVWVWRGGYVCIERSIQTDYGAVRQQIYLGRAIGIRIFGTEIMRLHLMDHRNLDKLDNRRENLRIATSSQNYRNQAGRAKSGYKGVCQAPSRRNLKKPFIAFIGGGGRKNLGYFSTAEEAARAYDIEATRRFGEFAWLNFP